LGRRQYEVVVNSSQNCVGRLGAGGAQQILWDVMALERQPMAWVNRAQGERRDSQWLRRSCQLRFISSSIMSNSESYQTFLAYCDRLQYKYEVELRKSIDVKRSMKPRIVTGEPRIITDENE
jgi:hypothetical protein